MSILKNGATYRFSNRAAENEVNGKGRSLNVYGNSPSSEANVCLWTSDDDDICQQWVYEASATEDRGYLRCKGLGEEDEELYLDVYTGPGVSTVVGYNAHAYPIGNTAYLEIEEISGGYVRIKSMYNGRYLTTNQGSNGSSTGKDVNAAGNVYFYGGGLTDRSQDWDPILLDEGDDGESGSDNYDRNYLVYPTKYMKITQNYEDGNHAYCSGENPKDYPIDEACEDTDRSWFYCPCDEMKVVRVYTGGVNTLWMESTSSVVTPSGTYPKITIMVMHPEDEDIANLEGKTFSRGEAMFREGSDGLAPNNDHFHISVGTGAHNGGANYNGWEGPKSDGFQWSLTPTGVTLKPEEAFFIDTDFTTIINSNGLSFSEL